VNSPCGSQLTEPFPGAVALHKTFLHFGNFGPSNHTPSRYSFTISSPSLASVLSNWNPSLHLAVQVLFSSIVWQSTSPFIGAESEAFGESGIEESNEETLWGTVLPRMIKANKRALRAMAAFLRFLDWLTLFVSMYFLAFSSKEKSKNLSVLQ